LIKQKREETSTRVGDPCIHTKTAIRKQKKTRKTKCFIRFVGAGNFKGMFGFCFQ